MHLLQRSTSSSPLWIRFKAKSCTHPGRGVGCLAAAGWGCIGLEGGQRSRTFLSTALPSFQDELLIAGPGRGSPAWISPTGRQIPFPIAEPPSGISLVIGSLKARGMFCVDLVVFHLAFVGDGKPRALIWMTDHINSDSFAPIPGA